MKRDLPKNEVWSIAKASTTAAVERYAQADQTFAVVANNWDQDPWLLGTPSGTVDLRTGMLRSPDRADYITRQTAVTPAESPECPIWLQFLHDATAGDLQLIRFLRQWCGYTLTGFTTEHALLFIFGPGGNGKSVFLNIVRWLLEDYAITAPMDSFTAGHTDKHPADLARLNGARMVCASETEEGRSWAETRIKQLTGGDEIAARFMRQNWFSFVPVFKMVVIGNHKPELQNIDDATKRRMNMVPFVHTPTSPDRLLEDKLRHEGPAILRWIIEGCLDWQMHGLIRPKVVVDATAEYFSEQDNVRQWLDECCDVGERAYFDTSDSLFKSWTAFAIATGEKPRTAKWFAQQLRRQGFNTLKDTPGYRNKRGFSGVQVRLVDTSKQWLNGEQS